MKTDVTTKTTKKRRAALCVGTGLITLDVIRSSIDANTTLERRHAGGTCGNVLAILGYLGFQTAAVGRIGSDAAGAQLIKDLRASGVNTALLTVEDARRTPVIIQETYVDKRGRARHRFSRECPVCGAVMPGYRPLLIADVDAVATHLPHHRVFFFDRVAPGTLELAKKSRASGALIVFEPSGIKDEALFLNCLELAHVFKYSHERLSDVDSFAARAKVPLQIETLGEKGLRYRTRVADRFSSWKTMPSVPAPIVRDAAGSGDWCTAGLIARLAPRKDLASSVGDLGVVEGALRFGQALAALNCAYNGARGLMYVLNRTQTLELTTKLLANLAPTLPDDPLPKPPTALDETCVVCTTALH